jgi:hypothetical protein
MMLETKEFPYFEVGDIVSVDSARRGAGIQLWAASPSGQQTEALIPIEDDDKGVVTKRMIVMSYQVAYHILFGERLIYYYHDKVLSLADLHGGV